MRTTVIPAQITTVEDKIAGSLNLTQIIILMVPVIWTTVVYSVFPPKLHLLWYKFPLVIVVLVACLILSLRIKGVVILNWLLILLKYNLRPRYYLFNKNEGYHRILDLPIFEKKERKLFKKVPAKAEVKIPTPSFNIPDLIRVESLLRSSRFSLSFKSGKKGGMDVAFGQIKK